MVRRMLALITPEAKTRTKAKPARDENRRRVGSVMSAVRRACPGGAAAGARAFQDAGEDCEHDDAAHPGRYADQVQAERVDGALVVAGAGGVSDQGSGNQPDQRKDQRQCQAAAGAHSEQGGGNDGGDDDDSQPRASGFDVRHEVHEGAGEFRVPGDALPRNVRVAQDQYGDRGQRPDGAGGRCHGQRPGEGRMFRGVLLLGPGAVPVSRQDADGEDKAADHGGDSDVVDRFAHRKPPAHQRTWI